MMRVHFIGICGTAMATLAAMLKSEGHAVQGSDEHVYPPMSTFLENHEIPCLDGFAETHIPADIDLVVVGNAVSRGNPEVEAVLERKLRYRSLPEMVRETWLWDRRSIVVAGTHGKTTTASLLAWLLTDGGLDPSFLVGGVTGNFGTSYRLGKGPDFVIEGDEYDSAFFDKTAKFLKYLPDMVVVGNLEFDHADIYDDFAAIDRAARGLVRLLPRNGHLLVGADSSAALALGEDAPCTVSSFGLSEAADWRAACIEPGVDATTFEVRHLGKLVTTVQIPLLGEFNVRNALAAFVLGRMVGLEPTTISRSLTRFEGVRRRLEIRGQQRGVTIYDDFAHHPTAVRETLTGLRAALTSGRIWALFEPRSATACRRVFQTAFASAFGDADEVIIGSVYRSSLPPEQRLSETQLVEEVGAAGGRARHFSDVSKIVEVVSREAAVGDVVVVMSNGSFGGIHERLLDALGAGEET